jgi:uroporphyrinogen decarboxylase
LTREKPDRIPMDYWATAETTEILIKYFGCGDEYGLYRRLHIDKPVTVEPRYKGPPLADGSDGSMVDPMTGVVFTVGAGADIYGNRYRDVNYETGVYIECVHHVLAEYRTCDELEEKYTWPSVDDWDYSVIPSQIQTLEEYPIRGGGSEPFLVYKYLRGDAQAFIDLIEHPEMVHFCMEKIYTYSYENTRRIYERIPGKVQITYVAEDLGAQDDLMYSPEQIREFFLPGMKKMIQLAHEAGAFVFHHDDGAIRKIIPDLIEAGIDALNPVQWRCKGMERGGLKRDFGTSLIFHGGVDNQYTLPFGSPDEVRREVAENISILGKDGGYIIAPCHNIQSVTSPENIEALYETGYELGKSA